VLSGRGLCDELITRPEESYRLCCVVCDLETSRMGAPYVYDISRLRVNLNNSHTELYTGEFHVLHRSLSIVRIAQSRLQWAELVDCRQETRNMLCMEF